VTEAVQAAPGLWLPVAGFCEDTDHPDGLVRVEYRAKRVIANDPMFDEAVFRPAIPAGFHVDDTRTDPAYRSSRQAEEFSKGNSGGLDQGKLARAKELRQVVDVCSLYRNDHRMQWPASLEEAYRYTKADGKGLDQWVYRWPSARKAAVAVITERKPTFADGELVVFEDGFIEFVTDRQRLARLKGDTE
jgi:hypothetical protein